MTRLLTIALTTTLLTAPALAHPGHDHTGAPGGEQHHLLWIAGAVVAVVAIGFAVTRRARRHTGAEKINKD
jgi:hypothetical protein